MPVKTRVLSTEFCKLRSRVAKMYNYMHNSYCFTYRQNPWPDRLPHTCPRLSDRRHEDTCFPSAFRLHKRGTHFWKGIFAVIKKHYPLANLSHYLERSRETAWEVNEKGWYHGMAIKPMSYCALIASTHALDRSCKDTVHQDGRRS